MQPSTNWGNNGRYAGGLNTRGVEITDTDYTNYPPFIYASHATAPEQKELIAWFYNDTFPINSPINDWSIAYTAVDNAELSMNNIGVFLDDPDTPEYTTDNTKFQKIAFYSSITYNIARGTYGLATVGAYRRFYGLPYSDNYFNWSPDCHTNAYSGNTYNFLHNANYQGYAVMYKSFGIKSLFLEIHVKPYHLQGESIAPDLTLKEYASLSQQQRDDNPIAAAYAQVYIRSSASGNYATSSHDYGDIQAINALGLSDGTNTIYNYFSGVQIQGATPKIILPLWGFVNAGMESTSNYISHDIADNNGELFYGYDKIDGSVLQTYTGYYYCYKYMNGTDENIEYLRKCCAAYGLFFCDSVRTEDIKRLDSSELEANNGRWLHDEMYLGIIEDSGYTEGRYSHGIQNGLQNQYNWTDSTESSYNPDVPPVPENHYSSSTTFNTIGNLATLTRRYALSGGAVRNLGKNLWKISDDIAVSDPMDPYAKYDAQILNTFLTSNPIDCIISLRRYPLTLPYGNSTTIKLGKVDTLVGCYEMDEPCHTYEFRGIPIMPNFGNSFLDYAPYTEFELYVPFCGTTKLNPADILGRTLNVKLIVDFDTGTCTGYIMSNNLVIETINGSIAIDIPVTGTDSTTVQAQLSHGIITAESAKTQERMTYGKTIWPTGILSAALNPFGTANTFAQNEANVNKAQYDVEHTVAPSHVIGSASPVSKWAIDLNCRLIIYYPTGKCIELVNGVPQFESNELNMFGAHVGFATLDEVSHYDTYTGLVVGANPKLGQMQTQHGTRYATADELNMIRQAIEQGIII